MRRAINAALADVHVAIPGKVIAYDPAKGLADVEMQIQHSLWDEDGNRSYEDIGTLPGVPVAWPRAGGFVITLPLAVGDTGLLVFNSDAIGEWRATGQKSQPDDASRLSVGWPVFYPGLSADSNPLAAGDVTNRTSKMVLGEDGGNTQIVLDKTPGSPMIQIHKDATDFVALASLVQTAFDAGVKAVYNGHKHSTPSGLSGVPDTLIGTLGPVAAAKTKAK